MLGFKPEVQDFCHVNELVLPSVKYILANLH